MRLAKAGLWFSLASAGLVVAFVLWDAEKVSPGPISAVHAGPAAIAEDDCAACHGGFGESMRSACADCHADVEVQVAERRGFHGQLEDAGRCGVCHSEHHGAEFAVVGAAAFARAGVADRAAYAHEGLGFELAGRHAELGCTQCHANADVVVLQKGQHRFLGASQACASCHEDPHAGRLPDCRSCHGESEPFRKVATFAHPDSFPLAGKHAAVGCADCHPKDGDHSIEAGGSASATRAARSCEACHASPHAAPFLAAVAARLATAAGASCAGCHPVEGGPFGEKPKLSAAEHALAGFPLDKPHDEVTCAECHTRRSGPPTQPEVFARFRASHPGRDPDACAACHADPHAGQFEQGPWAGQGCLACHERHRFDPPRFGPDEHARTAFALTGKHVETACDACHQRAHETDPRRFRGTDATCSVCHADAHRAFFARAADPELAAAAGDCASCHTTASFAAVERFEHGAWTGFPIEGQHADAACEACHPRAAHPDDAGRSFGFASAVAAGPVQACASCHADVHGGFFAGRNGLAADVAADCARCHTAHGFAPARDGFDHAAWTGFALEGAHGRTACDVCHPGLGPPDAAGRRVRETIYHGEGPYSDCRTCHLDPHDGDFDRPGRPAVVDGRRGCERCHTQDAFDQVPPGRFDHAQWTGFALEGVHARAACESCHPRTPPGAGARTFAAARGTRCADCHADPHVAQFASGGRTDCARCHTSDADFLSVRFDHQRDARFALDATHARLSCGACHVPWPLPGGGSAVRYKPLGTSCGDCHDPRGPQRGPSAADERSPR